MRVKVVNNEIEIFPYGLRQLKADNPDTSYPAKMTDADFEALGIYRIVFEAEPAVTHSQTFEPNAAPVLVDGAWTLGWTVRDKTADEIADEAGAARYRRNELLTESDWTQIADNSLDDSTKTSWATYRTALRDISTQEGFPTNVTWPTAP